MASPLSPTVAVPFDCSFRVSWSLRITAKPLFFAASALRILQAFLPHEQWKQ